MAKSIKKNYLYNVSYQIFAYIVPLITTPYIARVLGAENIGIYSYTYSMLRYFWLFAALGIAALGSRTIGINQDDPEQRSYVFWDLTLLKGILSTIMIALYSLYVIIVAQNKFIALIQGINLFAVLFDITFFYSRNGRF